MGSSGDLGQLRTEKWEQLQDLADRFEDAWKDVQGPDGAPDLANFVPPAGDLLRAAALQELIKTDLEIRWRRKEPCLLESYLSQFPELGTPDTVSPQLILEEYCIRQKHGDK